MPVLYEVINGEAKPIGGGNIELTNIIGDKWNEVTTYSIGDLKIHNNIFWKCLIQNKNSEPKEGNTNWEKTSIEKELKALWAAIK